MAPLVSVAMAVCDGEKYLSEQIDSIFAQSHENLELVITDDASTDGTAQILENASKGDARLRFIRNPKRLGIVFNFMKAVSLCRGEFVAFCDQDDVWSPDKLNILRGLLSANPRNILAYSDLDVCDKNLETSKGSFWRQSGIRPFSGALREKALLKNLSPGCSMMFRRPVADLIRACFHDTAFGAINSARILDETPFMHDHLAQVLAAGLGNIVYTRQKLVRYRQHTANNIGAFYKAMDSKQVFADCLAKRIQALGPYQSRLPEIGWDRIRQFYNKYSAQPRGPMPEFFPYFLFMRNAPVKDQIFGALDCLVPSIYQKARQYAKNRS